MAQNPPANAGDTGDTGSIPGLGRFPWRKKWLPTPGFLPGESNGQGSLVGYSPWGHKESDTTEQLHFKETMMAKDLVSYNGKVYNEAS